MNLKELRADIASEVEAILAIDFVVNVTNTQYVPHSDDAAITFPNLDAKRQSSKVIETCVLYIDIRRSTELNLQHRAQTVSRLYSSFVRAMVRCAEQYNGHVRGIIGDRLMVLYDVEDCFSNAVHTAFAMNTVAKHIINKYFKRNEVECGIGIDFGRMLVTKTGFRRHGVQRHNYRSLVWLGRPANVASKLTDIANKGATYRDEPAVHVGRMYGSEALWTTEPVETFLPKLEVEYLGTGRLFRHSDAYVFGFFPTTRRVAITPDSPPILMTRVVYDGYRSKNPTAKSIVNNWIKRCDVIVPGYSDVVFGGDVTFVELQGP
ncbi:adenylate/guanylate cyclase domain-containing protein [Caballeronia sp. LZ019]|uniref:adenylate/guanylate cyclase domain-containing protein n=1 Tax=Caballeronia sp. LZ019 TaxID=3038555 RepID=UPI00285A082B|nr:adenylate/guanylate cyclase domain-containing protein [Caballeronia sp. LZ019]MDR5809114.1 adenylate/guanylate cyclase domain-containing protein [Caballeronia sp. LZ019]